jgi:hypothetical protein
MADPRYSKRRHNAEYVEPLLDGTLSMLDSPRSSWGMSTWAEHMVVSLEGSFREDFVG